MSGAILLHGGDLTVTCLDEPHVGKCNHKRLNQLCKLTYKVLHLSFICGIGGKKAVQKKGPKGLYILLFNQLYYIYVKKTFHFYLT